VAVGHVTETGVVGVGLDLVLRQTYYVTWLEPHAAQPEIAREIRTFGVG
jgi:hypothetical protein